MMFIFFVISVQLVESCLQVRVTSERSPELTTDFFQIPVESNLTSTSNTGRAIYSTPGNYLFLYHSTLHFEMGSWVISGELGDGSNAVAYIDSWAVTPYLVHEVADSDDAAKISWRTFYDNEWSIDESLVVECIDEEESTIFFDGDPNSDVDLSSFYVLRASETQTHKVYSKIKNFEVENSLFLFKYEDRWMIGESIGEDGKYHRLHK